MVCIVVVMYKFVCWFGCVVVFGLMFVGFIVLFGGLGFGY